MENINTALHTIVPGDYLVSIDLKDAYFSILIFKPHRKFLRFKWSDQTYEFTCLPFGYSLAPRVFTKVLQPVISHLRENSYRVVIFLDDIHFIGSSVEECLSKLSFLEIYCKAWDLSLMSINPSFFQSRALFIWDSLLI